MRTDRREIITLQGWIDRQETGIIATTALETIIGRQSNHTRAIGHQMETASLHLGQPPTCKNICQRNHCTAIGSQSHSMGMRIHLTRQTNYGDRFKLYVLDTPEAPKDPKNVYGVTIEAEGDGFVVADTAFKGQAETRGIKFGDIVTGIDVQQLGRPAKEWVYPLALAVLGFVIMMQRGRKRREDDTPDVSSPEASDAQPQET